LTSHRKLGGRGKERTRCRPAQTLRCRGKMNVARKSSGGFLVEGNLKKPREGGKKRRTTCKGKKQSLAGLNHLVKWPRGVIGGVILKFSSPLGGGSAE